MPPEVLAHAFESFFTTKSATKGAGLALLKSTALFAKQAAMSPLIPKLVTA